MSLLDDNKEENCSLFNVDMSVNLIYLCFWLLLIKLTF